MQWRATDEQTLTLSEPDAASLDVARSALGALSDIGDAEAYLVEHLRLGLDAGVLQASSLAALGRLCHGAGPPRDSARAASEAIFDLVLPTPTIGREADYFWRVARALEARERPGPAPERSVRFKSFARRNEAAAFASGLGERLVSITESASGALLAPSITVWYWEG